MLLTEEEREGPLYIVREKTDEEIIQQIEETLKDKTISKSTRFSSARLWLEVLEKQNETPCVSFLSLPLRNPPTVIYGTARRLVDL